MSMNNGEMYFRFCEACNCYEYDCHGLEGCIKLDPDYKSAPQRAMERISLAMEQEKRR
jgi:hypothetical protein